MGFASGLAAGASLGRAVREGKDKRTAEKREKEVAAGLVALDEQQALATDIAARPPQKQMTIDEYRAGLVPVGDEVVSAPGTNVPDPAMANMGPAAPTVMSNVDRLRAEQAIYNQAGDLETARGLRKDIAAAERTALEDKRYDTEQRRQVGLDTLAAQRVALEDKRYDAQQRRQVDLDARDTKTFEQQQAERERIERERVAKENLDKGFADGSIKTAEQAISYGAANNLPVSYVQQQLQTRQGITDAAIAANDATLDRQLGKFGSAKQIEAYFNDEANSLTPGFSVKTYKAGDGKYVLEYAPDDQDAEGAMKPETFEFGSDAEMMNFMRTSAKDKGLAATQLYDSNVRKQTLVYERMKDDREFRLEVEKATQKVVQDAIDGLGFSYENMSPAEQAGIREGARNNFLASVGNAMQTADSQGLNNKLGSDWKETSSETPPPAGEYDPLAAMKRIRDAEETNTRNAQGLSRKAVDILDNPELDVEALIGEGSMGADLQSAIEAEQRQRRVASMTGSLNGGLTISDGGGYTFRR
jgi:hypothetical protein